MSSSPSMAFIAVREGKPRVRWGSYTLGLTLLLATTALVNGILLKAGVWSGVDTVIFGLLVSAVIFNLLVLYQMNRAASSGPAAESIDRSSGPGGPPPGSPSSPSAPANVTCPRCGAPIAATTTEGLCPACLMSLNLSAPTELTGDVADPAIGPAGTQVVKQAIPSQWPLSEVAAHFPQLEIIECLGRGGMGVVYKARQPHLDRCVALKILAPGKEQHPAFAERFTREAQLLARLTHPHIVILYDFGKVDGWYYLLMEYVDGVSLRQLLQTHKITPEQALAIIPKICDALQYAHDRGVVHRDIKPENVLLMRDGQVKIADFGIAKMVGEDLQHPAITGDAQVIGTPHYMAPEQVERPQSVDHRADIYSLGVVFYEMLTGELPLGRFAPPSSRMPGVQVDVRLDEVVLRALEKEPARRYQRANEVKTDLASIAARPMATLSPEGSPPAQPPKSTLSQAPSGVFSPFDSATGSGSSAARSTAERPSRTFLVALTTLLAVVALLWMRWIYLRGADPLADTANARVNGTAPIAEADVISTPQNPAPWTLGPELEREIRGISGERPGSALDVDTGNVVELPSEIVRGPSTLLARWMHQQQLELIVGFYQGGWVLLTKEVTLKPLPRHWATSATLADLRYALAAEGESRELAMVGVGADGFMRFEVPPTIELPTAFVFQTTAGNLGVLEIIEINSSAGTMRLKSRLVQAGGPQK